MEIIIFVEKREEMGTIDTLRYIQTPGYLQKELVIANDPQFRAVLCCHPETSSVTKMVTNRWDIGIHDEIVAASLLYKFDSYLGYACDTQQNTRKLKRLLALSLWEAYRSMEVGESRMKGTFQQ